MGSLIGFKDLSTDKDYFYVKNLQGDIIRIVDSLANLVATYEYDDWGKLLVAEDSLTAVGKLNPFRYRGYYYDTESGLYYLNSRYYDPETCRFISQDSYLTTGQGFAGFNMYAYCLDNPVNYVDYNGNSAIYVPFRGGIGIVQGSSLLNGIVKSVSGALGLICATLVAPAKGSITDTAKSIGKNMSAVSHVSPIIPDDPEESASSTPIPEPNDVDWGKGDHHHALTGTKGKHIKGWERFGINGNDDGNWPKLLPILDEVIRYADDVQTYWNKNGTQGLTFLKYFSEQGVNVKLNLWLNSNGIYQFSDAIPYIVK